MRNGFRAVVVCLVLMTGSAGCHKATTVGAPVTPAPVAQRIAQYNQIISTANNNAATVVASLVQAGVITATQGQQVAQYQAAIAKATTGIAGILQLQVPWTDKVIQIQNLALSLVPPSGYRTFGAQTDAQWQGLITALDGIESTVRIMVQMAQASPAGN